MSEICTGMGCPACRNFQSVPSVRFTEVGLSVERHGTLYICNECGAFLELIAEERSIRFLRRAEAVMYYPLADRGGG